MVIGKKIWMSVMVIFVSVFTIVSSPFLASAATYSIDGKSPYYNNCIASGVKMKSAAISFRNISGVIELRYSTVCKTAWARIQLSKPLPSGYELDGLVIRNNDRRGYFCSSANGNGSILPGQTSCYTPMVYDYNPNTSFASAMLFDPYGDIYDLGHTASY